MGENIKISTQSLLKAYAVLFVQFRHLNITYPYRTRARIFKIKPPPMLPCPWWKDKREQIIN